MYKDSVIKSLKFGMEKAELIEEADLYLLFGEISQEEHDEVITVINEWEV